jgi:hypothetical protein
VRHAQRLDELRVRLRVEVVNGRTTTESTRAISAYDAVGRFGSHGCADPSAVQTTRSYHSPLGERSERSTPKISEAMAAS